ncbi:carboxylesterase/lipase family protein [Myxococcota bacterium]|nr:carboxylesterase/lipase family protein [Myxococcota bacterium]MCZ7617980.1 carboxylesterase/lipase family protein [Myxococcota bacterium]
MTAATTDATDKTGATGATVETDFGKLLGTEADGVRRFLGIPYAQPPLGEHRFRPPAPPTPWSGARDATRFGGSAPQPGLMLAALPGMDVGPQDEDCLFLNVYAPVAARPGDRKPVLVWIHGGGFVIGSGSQGIYDGGGLVRRGDVVVVTINYRLGVLGFLDLGEQGDLATANAGILDQVAALRWVQRHIATFGGDPDNVTIFGESAGGMSVGTLLGCPAARGLFHKAIAQSGACHAVHADREASSAVTAAVLSTLGLASPNVRQLREVPVEKLLAAQQQVSMQMLTTGGKHLLPFQPIVDGDTLPRHPIDAVRAGSAAGVPLLIGTNRDEWNLFGFLDPELRQLDADRIAARVQRRLPHADGAQLVAGYRASRPEADWSALWFAIETDRVFRIPAIRLAEAQAPHAPAVHAYWFTWPSPGFGGRLGACHAIDVPFVFGGLHLAGADQFVGTGPAADRLAGQTMDAWLAFARSGAPGHPGLPDWPGYAPPRRATLELGPTCQLHEDPQSQDRQLWPHLL